VQNALADAAEYPQAKPWYRAVYADDEPIGFVMIRWNCEPQPPVIIGPWFLWKLLIDRRHQGRGYGSEVVRQVAELVQAEAQQNCLRALCLVAPNRPDTTNDLVWCRPATWM
jgi:diamine N-acetyltransferase